MDSVNEHYLNHVVATAAEHRVEASEDILGSNGMKLLAKGGLINAAVRDRLLEHKLSKPLENCVQVVGGVTAAALAPVAQGLLEQHGLLRALCADPRAPSVDLSLARLSLSPQLLSLLSVYAQQQPDRLAHATSVAMLALALARRLLPGEIDRHRMLATAGLVHDVGELYIDPQVLQATGRLTPEQWKHIVTHPLVGQRVLQKLAGAGPAVAVAVLNHHERLDGFGYPRGVTDDKFPLDGQILAAAEWLAALMESGASPLAHASVASKLMPGEFSPALLELISATARGSPEMAAMAVVLTPLDAMGPRLARIVATLGRFHKHRAWLDRQTAEAPPGLRALLQLGTLRMLRIQASFSSTGLDLHGPDHMLKQLEALPDPQAHLELGALVREFGWRMQELERECTLRASLLSPSEQAVTVELMARMNEETR